MNKEVIERPDWGGVSDGTEGDRGSDTPDEHTHKKPYNVSPGGIVRHDWNVGYPPKSEVKANPGLVLDDDGDGEVATYENSNPMWASELVNGVWEDYHVSPLRNLLTPADYEQVGAEVEDYTKAFGSAAMTEVVELANDLPEYEAKLLLRAVAGGADTFGYGGEGLSNLLVWFLDNAEDVPAAESFISSLPAPVAEFLQRG